jgi:hypothetical protein
MAPASTTSTTLRSCSPPACDDRGPCTLGQCVDGVCQYEPTSGATCAQAIVNEIGRLIDTAPASAFESKVFRRRLMGRFNHLKTLVAAENKGGKPTVKAMRRGEYAFSALATFVDGAATHHRIDGDLANGLKHLAADGASALIP